MSILDPSRTLLYDLLLKILIRNAKAIYRSMLQKRVSVWLEHVIIKANHQLRDESTLVIDD